MYVCLSVLYYIVTDTHCFKHVNLFSKQYYQTVVLECIVMEQYSFAIVIDGSIFLFIDINFKCQAFTFLKY